MKEMGVVMVLCGCVCMGFWFRFSYARKLKNLWEFQRALQILQGEIRYGRTPLPHALEQAGNRVNGIIQDFLLHTALLLEEGSGGMQKIWEQAIREKITTSDMRKCDRKIILEMGATLGYLDVELQSETLSMYEQRVKESIHEYTEEKKNRMRLYPVLGSMCGVLICLVIL